MMGSQDRVTVELNNFALEEKFAPYKDFESKQDDRLGMWSFIRPEPPADGFAALLAGNGGKEVKENARSSWDMAPPKAYVPLARSRSSLSNDSLQRCTEGLGCESCDGLTDSAPSSESSSVILDDYLSVDEEEEEAEDEEEEISFFDVNEEKNLEEEEGELNLQTSLRPRSFPPPLPSLSASSASHMRSFKKDGRFVLQSVKVPSQNYLHSFREGGRLKMQLVNRPEEDFPFHQAASLNKPENRFVQEEREEEKEDDGGGGGSELVEEECSNYKVPVPDKCSDFPPLQEWELLPENFPTEMKNLNAVTNSFPNFHNNEIGKENAARETKGACNLSLQRCKSEGNKSTIAKSIGDTEILETKTSPKATSCTGSCFNVYNGWRTELAEQNSSVFCQNWQKAQCLPNYPVNKLKYTEATKSSNANLNVNESCIHSRPQKYRVNDLGLGRCHEPKSLPVWGKSPCIATSS
uniref:TSA: Wollemia nobilis Ref_Wollemi_Transcript_18852_2051 transcribed RNA sequence n=1 Tax=Wollemia nobilis TaxID=56998 RepID=A0A0C9S5L5_9CONI